MKPWESYQSGPWQQFAAPPVAPASPPEPSLEQRRADVAEGITLRPFGIDTGIELPQTGVEFLAGAGKRLREIGTLGMAETDAATEELLDDSTAAQVGEIAADLTSMAGVGSVLRAGAFVPRIGRGLRYVGEAISRPQSLRQAVTGGAAYGAATTADREENAVMGGLGGGLGYGIPAVAGRVIAPRLQAGADMLADRGITMTPGELLGGWVQRIEDGATSIPFVGDFIRGAKGQSLKQFNKAMIDDALKPINQSLGDVPVGRQGLDRASRLISERYDEILPQMNVRLDETFVDEVAALDAMVDALPEAQQRFFRNYMDENLLRPFDNENLLALGQTFKETDSALRKTYKKFQSSNDPFQNQLGDALREAHRSLMGMAKRQNPNLAQELAATDMSYAMLNKLLDAASFVGAKDGVFTPAHLVNAVKKSAGKQNFARGRGFDQAIAEAAKDVLPSTVPDSGTPFRALTGMGTLGGAYFIDPMLVGGMATGAGLYSRPGVKTLETLIARRPQLARTLGPYLEQLAPVTAGVGTSAYLQ